MSKNAKEKKSPGSIVYVLSSVVCSLPPAKHTEYVLLKYALMGLMKTQAVEFARSGIRVNAVSPGAIPTATEAGLDPEEQTRIALGNQCIKRRGTPEDIANLVYFLASDESDFITGQSIAVDGGWIMH